MKTFYLCLPCLVRTKAKMSTIGMLVVLMRSKIERHQHLMDFARSRGLKTGQGHVEGRGEARASVPVPEIACILLR